MVVAVAEQMTAEKNMSDAVGNFGGERKFDGAIYDLDGTLVDTETCACKVMNVLLRRYAEELQLSDEAMFADDPEELEKRKAECRKIVQGPEEHQDKNTNIKVPVWTKKEHVEVIGMVAQDWSSKALLLRKINDEQQVRIPWIRLVNDYEVELRLVYDTEVIPLPGAACLTEKLAKSKVFQCIATSSGKEAVAAKRVGGRGENAPIFSRMEFVVTGEEVTRGKPDPEIFELAAKKLGLPPSNCVAFEDSPHGCKSAKSAGCFVVAIPEGAMSDEVVRARFGDVADLIIRSLEEFPAEQFFKLDQKEK